MKQQFRLISALIIAGLAIISQSSCKEHTLIDAKVAPTIDNIHVFQTDTFTVLTKTVLDDSLATSSSISGIAVYHGLGAIDGTNATFGNTSEGIYLQVIPEVLSPTFLGDPTDVVDSTAVMLPYAGYSFGNTSTTQTQTFKVYRITDTFSNTNAYQAVNPVNYDQGTVLGSASNVNLQNLISDSVIVDGLKRGPMLRINLDMSNGSAFHTIMQNANLQSDIPDFLLAFRGLYIAPDTTLSKDLIPYFQLDGVDTYSRASMLVYHHNSSAPGEQIFQYYFDIQTCAHYNRITRNFSGAYAQSLTSSKAVSDSVALIQNLPGLAIDVQIPFLNNAFDQSKSKFIINSAQLIITQINTGPLANPIFGPLVKMTVTGVGNKSDSLYDISDAYPVTSPYAGLYIDGNAKQVTVGGVTTNQYILNMPREVMAAIAQKRAVHIRLNGTIDYPGSMQTVVGGGTNSNPNYRMKLNIVYTKI